MHSLAYLQDLITTLVGALAYIFYASQSAVVIKSCRCASFISVKQAKGLWLLVTLARLTCFVHVVLFYTS